MQYVVSFREGDQIIELWAMTLDAARAIKDALIHANAPDLAVEIRFQINKTLH